MQKKYVFLLVMTLAFVLAFGAFSPVSLAEAQPSAKDEAVRAAGEKSEALPALPEDISDIKLDVSKIDSLKGAMSEDEAKLSTKLLQLTNEKYIPEGADESGIIKGMETQGQIITNGSVKGSLSGKQVYVYIQLVEGTDPDVLKQYVSKIDNSDYDAGLIVAWVDITKLKGLSSLREIESVYEVTEPDVYSGDKITEGDSFLSADKARETLGIDGKNIDGTGVKVGIVSDGVDNYLDAVSSKDIPSDVTILRGGYYEKDVWHGGDEGTAMLEIVHDLAPGAKLYFHDMGKTAVDFCDAVESLAKAGCKVICDDVYFKDQPFFQDGYIASEIKDIIARYGVTYCSAAGNDADGHYQGKFYNSNNDDFMDFSRGTDDDYKNLYIYLEPGEKVTIVMQWDDTWGIAKDDYDLYLSDTGSPEAHMVDMSTYYQNGKGNPFEIIEYVNDGEVADGKFVIWARAYNSYALKNKKTLELYIYTSYPSQVYQYNIKPADSIYGHPAVSTVLACGAINANPNDNNTDGRTCGVIEPYSSNGPVTHLTETINKPDVCGVDGVTITGAGGFGYDDGTEYRFYGTSAAAPHVAALCALVKQRFPSLSASSIRNVIKGSADDKGVSGYDKVYGYGAANALKAVNYYHYVTYDSQGGSSVSRQMIRNNSLITYYKPTRSGYDFGGWYTSTDLNDKWDYKTDKVTADMTLYAKWGPKPPAIAASVKDYKSVKLSWNSVSKAEGYEIWRKAYGEADYKFINSIKSITSLRYTDTDLQGQIKYYYKVRSYWTQGGVKACGNFSDYKYATPVWPKVYLSAKSYDYNSIKLNWTDLSSKTSLTGYVIYRSASKYGPWDKSMIIAQVKDAVPYIDSDALTKSKIYYYKVRAYEEVTGGTIYSSQSSYSSAKAEWPAVSLIEAKATDYDTITLKWKSLSDANGYNILRSTSKSGKYFPIGTAPADALTYADNGVTMGKTYYYKVQAFDNRVSPTEYSPISSYKYAKTIPDTPTNLTLTSSGRTADITWDEAGGASGYIIYRSTSKSGTYSVIKTTKDLSYTNTGLTAGRTYYYKIRAYHIFSNGSRIYGNYSGYQYVKITG